MIIFVKVKLNSTYGYPNFIFSGRSLFPIWFSWSSWTVLSSLKCEEGYHETYQEIKSEGMVNEFSISMSVLLLCVASCLIYFSMVMVNAYFLQLTAVHLVDAHLCSDPGKYVSALLLSLSTMLHLDLPHINVLSKIDLIESYGKLGMYNFLNMTKLVICTMVHTNSTSICCSIQPWFLYRRSGFIVLTVPFWSGCSCF